MIHTILTPTEKCFTSGRPQTPYIMVKGSDPTLTDALADAMTEKFGYPPEYTVQIGATVSCNAGHNVVGFIVRGRKKS